jgi:hypothetical protein
MRKRKRIKKAIAATNWIALPDQTKSVNSSGSKLPTEETTMKRIERRELIESYCNPPFQNLKARMAKIDAAANKAALTQLVLKRAAERKTKTLGEAA